MQLLWERVEIERSSKIIKIICLRKIDVGASRSRFFAQAMGPTEPPGPIFPFPFMTK
jgi:hypothetical protein